MRIPRIYLDASFAVGEEIALDERAHHHVVKVLRCKAGARVTLFNGQGGEYLGTLAHIQRRTSTAVVNAFNEVERESPLKITLLQGVSKSARMDYTLQKAVELGVQHIQPVSTRYAAVNPADWSRKMEHWRGVIVSACEQSGRTRLPTLFEPATLSERMTLADGALGLALAPDAANGMPAIDPAPRDVALLVGPEGGLDDEELARARDAGFMLVRLGPRTLRTETAGIAALTAVQLLWGDLR